MSDDRQAQFVSLVNWRDYPTPNNVESLVVLNETEKWCAPSPRSIFGETDQNYRQVAAAFRTTRNCTSVPVYVAQLRDVLVSPKGIVFTSDGKVLYESLFPWQTENYMSQFASEFIQNDSGAQPAVKDVYENGVGIHCREGGEVGYFHFINSILPRLAVSRRLRLIKNASTLLSTSARFSSEMVQMLELGNLISKPAWRHFDSLFYISPFTFQGDHFWRPPFAARLTRDLLSPLMPSPVRPRRRVYLSRDDAEVRRLENEAAVFDLLSKQGFEKISIGVMSIREQMKLFSETEYLVSAHGAGLSNMAFMNTSSSILEIVSPSRLWPTFRMMAARCNVGYHAIIGSAVKVEEQRGEGNEDFSCDLTMLRMGIAELLQPVS